MPSDTRQFAPATQRNREPILQVLHQVLPPQGLVLEIASGTGEHAIFFAPSLTPRVWLPSDRDPVALESIQAWQNREPATNLLPPMVLDVSQPHWPETVKQATPQLPLDIPLTAIVSINMVHISPWSATIGLMTGAGELLPPGGVLYLYGPYKQGGLHTAPSNAAFDASLRSRDLAWGVRDLEDVMDLAAQHGLRWCDTVAMPANNLSVVFEREG